MEMKTNGDGKAVLDVIPVGDSVRLQIIASGFQTYGADYQLDGATKEIEVSAYGLVNSTRFMRSTMIRRLAVTMRWRSLRTRVLSLTESPGLKPLYS